MPEPHNVILSSSAALTKDDIPQIINAVLKGMLGT